MTIKPVADLYLIKYEDGRLYKCTRDAEEAVDAIGFGFDVEEFVSLEKHRAAMLQGAENAGSPTTMKTAPALDSSPKIAESPSGINQGKCEPVATTYKLPDDIDVGQLGYVPDEEQCKPHPVMAVKGELGFLDHFNRIIDERDDDIDIGQLGSSNYEALMLAALDAFRAAMLQGAAGNSPVIPDGWVACSERMPGDLEQVYIFTNGVVWKDAFYNADEQLFYWEYSADTCKASDASHWMPMIMPAAPQQEV